MIGKLALASKSRNIGLGFVNDGKPRGWGEQHTQVHLGHSDCERRRRFKNVCKSRFLRAIKISQTQLNKLNKGCDAFCHLNRTISNGCHSIKILQLMILTILETNASPMTFSSNASHWECFLFQFESSEGQSKAAALMGRWARG